MSDTTQPDDGVVSITRRRAIAGAVVGATGVGGVAHLAGDASAQAEVTGDFSATGDEATLSAPPAALRVDATGEWAVDTGGSLQQVQITLQATVDGETAALDEAVVFESTSGTYDLSGDVLANHDALSAVGLMPDEPDATRTTEVVVRVIVSAVRGGSIISEASVQDTVEVVVDERGVRVTVGGSATVRVEASD